jgi:hypothetical protein
MRKLHDEHNDVYTLFNVLDCLNNEWSGVRDV